MDDDHDDERESFRQRREEALERQVAQYQAVLQAAERRAEEERRRAEEEHRRAEEERQLRTGTFYSTLEQVWGRVSQTFSKADSVALLRSECPSVHKKTFDALRKTTTVAATNSVRSYSSRTSNFVDVFGRENRRADVAHLIPHSSEHANMYGDVASWALGLKSEQIRAILHEDLAKSLQREPTEEESTANMDAVIQKAIHGSRVREPSDSHRLEATGLKHVPSNKIRLHFDMYPCVLILPAMSLQKVKEWKGLGYDAIVLVETDKEEKDSLEFICGAIGMTSRGTLATAKDIELARQLLEDVLSGLADSVSTRGAGLFHAHPFFNVLSEIFVPTIVGHQRRKDRRVRKVTFGVGPHQHKPPDPLLLVVKAAVIWSKRYGQQLLAGGEKDDEVDSLSEQAMEEYEEWLDQKFRRESLEGLIVYLDQPSGYCSDDEEVDYMMEN